MAGARVFDQILRMLLRHKAQEEPVNKREQGRCNHVERLSHTRVAFRIKREQRQGARYIALPTYPLATRAGPYLESSSFLGVEAHICSYVI